VQYPGDLHSVAESRGDVELWARDGSGAFGSSPAIHPRVSGGPDRGRREGDKQVPEGFYEIDRFNPKSLSPPLLGLNYPNAATSCSRHEHPAAISSSMAADVTVGCAPLGDEAIEELYLAALDAHDRGQTRIQVHVFPDRMSGPEWERYAAGEIARRRNWRRFGRNCVRIEYFERRRVLPIITVGRMDAMFWLRGGLEIEN